MSIRIVLLLSGFTLADSSRSLATDIGDLLFLVLSVKQLCSSTEKKIGRREAATLFFFFNTGTIIVVRLTSFQGRSNWL